MVGWSIALGARVLVAAVLVLTGIWKVLHREEFEAAFARLAPASLARSARVVAPPIAALELGIAAVLLLGLSVSELALAGPIAGSALVTIFTLALARGEAGDCGCWFASPSEAPQRAVPLARNAVLLVALGGAAVLSPHGLHGVPFTAGLAPTVTALIFAVLLIDAPQIMAVASFEHHSSGA